MLGSGRHKIETEERCLGDVCTTFCPSKVLPAWDAVSVHRALSDHYPGPCHNKTAQGKQTNKTMLRYRHDSIQPRTRALIKQCAVKKCTGAIPRLYDSRLHSSSKLLAVMATMRNAGMQWESALHHWLWVVMSWALFTSVNEIEASAMCMHKLFPRTGLSKFWHAW